jgi:hypothetical protein
MGDHHEPASSLQDPHFQIDQAAAQLHQHRILAVAERLDGRVPLQDLAPGLGRISHPHQLDLGDHQGIRGRGHEAAAGPAELGSVADRGHHRGLLAGHGHQDFAPVDDHVGGDAQRQGEGADHVLHQPIGQFEGQVAGVPETRQGLGFQRRDLGHRLQPLVMAESAKPGDARGSVCHDSGEFPFFPRPVTVRPPCSP